MPAERRGHDDRLLDALDDLDGIAFAGIVWRVVRAGRSVLDGSRGAGRWNPAHLSVLYCAQDADGALAEIFFHLSRGQSVFPSRMKHDLFKLQVRTANTLQLLDMDQLRRLGVDDARYRELLYQRTQEIADAAAFLGFDGLIAPSARYECNNLILFLQEFDPENIEVMAQTPADWSAWRRRS
jgi:RES domain-containing protein